MDVVTGKTARIMIFASLAAVLALLLRIVTATQAGAGQYYDAIPGDGLIPRTGEWE